METLFLCLIYLILDEEMETLVNGKTEDTSKENVQFRKSTNLPPPALPPSWTKRHIETMNGLYWARPFKVLQQCTLYMSRTKSSFYFTPQKRHFDKHLNYFFNNKRPFRHLSYFL